MEVKHLVNTQLLNYAIDNSGLKRSFIAEKLKISRQSLLRKVSGKSEFTGGEIQELSNILSLGKARRDEIFFA